MSEEPKDPYEGYVHLGWHAFWCLFFLVVGVFIGIGSH